MPGFITSYSGLSNELLNTCRETRLVEGENRNAPFPLPPFGKVGLGGFRKRLKILLNRVSDNVILRREPKNLEGVGIKVYKILRFAQNDN
jgi:hypothetical protein